MKRSNQATFAIVGTLMLLSLLGCGGGPAGVQANDGRLGPCPDRPNCVASDATDDAHHITPFHYDGDQATVWNALKDAVAELPRTIIIKADDTYLHAEARSQVFRFVDDLEFQLRPEENLIALRSAARTGYRDFGVNAERLEALRQRLTADGILP